MDLVRSGMYTKDAVRSLTNDARVPLHITLRWLVAVDQNVLLHDIQEVQELRFNQPYVHPRFRLPRGVHASECFSLQGRLGMWRACFLLLLFSTCE
jgi:hypothetical protein